MSLRDELAVLKSKFPDRLTKDEALDLALEAAQLHIKFLGLVNTKTEKDEIRKNCNLILGEAERIKSADAWDPDEQLSINFAPLQSSTIRSKSAVELPGLEPGGVSKSGANEGGDFLTSNPPEAKIQVVRLTPSPTNSRILPPSEEILLLQASKLHGSKFPPWKAIPEDQEFQSSAAQRLFIDEPEIHMSDDQRSILDGWKRPSDALPPPSLNEGIEQRGKSGLPSMEAQNKVDFVQDAATDCSVVASLAAATARAQKGHAKLLSTVVCPYDIENDRPAMSPNGKYILRLNFNGCARRVVIDDRLPVSKTARILHLVDRSNPSLLWPALLEKGYLKVRGGYDFPGSNSGTDLWILTGWIPEQVVLQYDETNVGQLWARVYRAFNYGDVIVTLGTGKMTSQTERDSGLAGEHDYAVLDMKEDGLRQYLLIKNPWLKGTSWKDHRNYNTASNDSTSGLTTEVSYSADISKSAGSSQLPLEETEDISLGPGTFWMEMSDIMQYFESIYLNWNPGLFKLRQDIHFVWDLRASNGGPSPPGSFTRNPQHTVASDRGGPLWLVLSKHFKDKAEESRSTTSDSDGGFIKLCTFLGNGQRVNLSHGATKQGLYVDSPQTLLQLELAPQTSYTIVVSGEDLPLALHTFTLSAFSNSPFTLNTAVSRYTTQTKTVSSWTNSTAGGNSNAVTYPDNPQFSFTLPSQSAVSLMLETLIPNVSVHVKLVHGYGQRVFGITAKDIVVDSGNYRRGCAQARTAGLDAGTYTIICSTFEPGQQGDFTLLVESLAEHVVKPIAKAGAGRIRTRFADASFGAEGRVLAAPLAPMRLARVNFTARYIGPPGAAWDAASRGPGNSDGSPPIHSPTRLTVELGRGPDGKTLVSSSGGAFSDSLGGLRTEDVDLSPDMAKNKDVWLVLEKLGGFQDKGRVEERIAVEMWADSGNAVDAGAWRGWER